MCTGKDVQMKLKETRLQGLEEVSRKVGRGACGMDIVGTFEILMSELDLKNTGCIVHIGSCICFCIGSHNLYFFKIIKQTVFIFPLRL